MKPLRIVDALPDLGNHRGHFPAIPQNGLAVGYSSSKTGFRITILPKRGGVQMSWGSFSSWKRG